MKVYVVKNDKNEYMTETGDFINSLWQAELFYDYECAYCYAPSGCNIVECSLMEKYQLADYTKQVRKEVCEQIKAEFDTSGFNKIGASLYPPTEEAMWIGKGFNACKERLFNKLDQIQGETK